MPDDNTETTTDAKAQKLAAARKKLKEYQQRHNNNNNSHSAALGEPETVSLASSCDSEGAEAQSAPSTNGSANDPNLQAIQLLIAEKGQLNAELTKCRLLCRERDLELEELRLADSRLEPLQQRVDEQYQQNIQLQKKLSESQTQIEDQQAHLSEMEAQLKQLQLQYEEQQQLLASKSNELEMSQLRLRQLNDESQLDNRVEALTQTQYMYEQQIRDLQAMVGQLSQDKEQASTQYQNYVQHQNSELAKLNELNAELQQDLGQLKERERQLVEHVSGLEREIQKNLSLQAHFKEEQQQERQANERTTELNELKEQLSDFQFERHEFQLKIKSQDDQLQLKEAAIAELEEQLERLQTEQPDQSKLLATMESDKVAASRALSQNVEMKQQLDELEKKFVQLTNDKAELVIKLDAEEFANREMRQNFHTMEQRLKDSEERFKFKDEEMIRLSHENVELQRQQMEGHRQREHVEEREEDSRPPLTDSVALPTAEAVEKLQQRFTTLISQVADLTEEKLSLEHLVLQLQGETETIGEYIALYQTQRRMLKQREYEKASQMRLLQAEREQLREKIEALNQLVVSLGVELPPDEASISPPIDKVDIENSQQILNRIQGIISEIKENTEQSPTTALSTDNQTSQSHCCLGKQFVV